MVKYKENYAKIKLAVMPKTLNIGLRTNAETTTQINNNLFNIYLSCRNILEIAVDSEIKKTLLQWLLSVFLIR